MTASIALEALKLNQSAPVELFVLDLTPIGGAVFRFAPQVNELNAAIVWQGNTYEPFPIQAVGFEARSSGPFPRPHLSASNVLGTLGPLIRTHDNLRGARVTRKRTMARFLDAVTFAAGNPTADPLAEFGEELWLIDRCVARNKLSVEWELCNPLDFVGVMLPARVVRSNYCQWAYRSSDCSYADPPVAKLDDSPTSLAGEDRCSKRLSGCKKRFGTAPLPFGGFPGVGQQRQL